jgi:hypothetical protein
MEMIVIPPGTFFAMEPNQIAAMLHVERLGNQLATDHPELGTLYRDTTVAFSARELGQRLLPVEAAISVEVVEAAVSYAVRLLLPEAERRELTRMRRSIAMRDKWDFDSPEWREHCRQASVARHAKHGVDVNAMLSARGLTAWTSEEKKFLWEVAHSDTYRSPNGHADYSKIAHEINRRFHGGKEIRYRISCSSMVADIKRKSKRP